MRQSVIVSHGGSHPVLAIPHTVSPYVCIDLVNSRFTDHTGTGEVYDRLASPAWQGWFARRCGVTPARPPAISALHSLARVRDLLRALLKSRQPPDTSLLAELNHFLARPNRFWELSRIQRKTTSVCNGGMRTGAQYWPPQSHPMDSSLRVTPSSASEYVLTQTALGSSSTSPEIAHGGGASLQRAATSLRCADIEHSARTRRERAPSRTDVA